MPETILAARVFISLTATLMPTGRALHLHKRGWLKLALRFFVGFAVVLGSLSSVSAADDLVSGAAVRYQLPTAGPLPQTYRVTLAITDPKHPDWILSTFLAGQSRTVTAENRGQFTESWDGLDDNFMPLPPGVYGVKGITMPAAKWRVDGEYHSVVPRFVGGPSCWLPTPDQEDQPEPFGGDPCGAPLADVDVGPNGVAVFYWGYLENGLNQPMFDLNKPIGYEQFLRAFGSGGAGGGSCTCTDGQHVWSFSTDGGPKYVYRADGKPFGTGRANRLNVYRPEGWVKAMACYRDTAAAKSYVFVAQGGRICETKAGASYVESEIDRVDKVTVHDGADGRVLAEWPLKRPLGLTARTGTLFILHQADDDAWVVSSAALVGGLPQAAPKHAFAVPTSIQPSDLEIDSHGRSYLSDAAANRVYQLDRAGKITRSFGRLDCQRPGAYDPQTLISPGKLAVWTDADGQDRLIVVEDGGPNRASEWSADGRLLREFLPPQTRANDGWTSDPEQPDHVYIAGQQNWLTRFKVDYEKHRWTINAVWPDVGDLRRPVFIRREGRCYLACRITAMVYRLDGQRWVRSAAVLREGQHPKWDYFVWHDANGDGRVQAEEKTRLELPGWLLRYHGNNWLADLSLIAPNQAGPDVWRLAPAGFDDHGNPIFRSWEKVLTDPVFEARQAGTATALFGANELAETYASDWGQVDGSLADGFFVNARGGRSFSANEGAQYKISRYVPDGCGGYKLKWRTGRAALQGLAQPGEIYGAIHVAKPINGLVSVIDQSRCGVLLYTEDGLYVDTVFPDGRRFPPDKYGLYPQPGEFFAGFVYPHRQNGKIYFGMGKVSPLVYEAVGWTLQENPVRPLADVQPTVTLTAGQIANPPEIALAVRGGAGSAKLARFAPATGGANLDGTLRGWESCDPVRFSADQERTVEARLLYDADHLYLRWHARLGMKFEPKPLQPVERLFAHDRLADTLSLYLQGDLSASPGGPVGGRPGDVRIVFGVCRDGEAVKPVAVGMYPRTPAGVAAKPATFRTPVNRIEFGHVGLLDDTQLNWVPDPDGRGFVLTAAISRSAVPGLPLLRGGLRSMINFEATLAGHNKFWWSNADGSASKETYDEPTEAGLYPGSWAPAQFLGLAGGVLVRHWQICGPFGGPGFEKLTLDPQGPMPGTNRDWKQATRELCEAAAYPPDEQVDLAAAYRGDLIAGYWNKLGEVRWRKAPVDDLDTRVRCGSGGQVYYGVTWLYVPVETELEFQFQGHPMTPLRWFLNGQALATGPFREEAQTVRLVASQPVTLRAGWNEVKFRGYCVGYPPFRAGLILTGAEEKLWTLRLSDTPPTKE